MTVLARFRALPDKDKASLIRKLVENGTPDFDFFFLIGLSTLMATFGLLLNSGSIVIGSMLIAPLMYPILGVSLGLVMMGDKITLLHRSFTTLVKALLIGLGVSTVAAIFGDLSPENLMSLSEVMSRTTPSLLHLSVAIVAGAAVSYTLARPEWSDTLPGVAIAVALIPPLATIGVGLAAFDMVIAKGAAMILALNLFGIIAVSVVMFLLMNLSEKESIAKSTIKKEDERVETEKKVIAEVAEEIQEEKKEEKEESMGEVVHEDIKA